MNKGIFNKRIPTVIALFFLLVIVGISTVLIQSGIFYVGKAAPDTQPLNFIITNITDTSFTATFSTTGQVDAVISMNNATTGNALILDDRDKRNGSSAKYYTHHITIQNLAPETTYTFKLIVGGKEYQSTSYTGTTGTKISSPPPNQNPLFGSVLLPNGDKGNDTVVIAKTDDSQSISSITDQNGEFILPTNSLRKTNGIEYLFLEKESKVQLSFYRQSMTAEVVTTYAIAQSLPTTTLTQKYSFLPESEVQMPLAESKLTFTVTGQGGDTVAILRPREGEKFIDSRPVFSGTSFPNSSVTVTVSGFAAQQILTRADGSWTYQPTNGLSQGDHSISITVIDANNDKTSKSARFSVFPLGSQVIESATPSATPKVQPTATPTKAAPSPTTQPTVAPTTVQTTPVPTTVATATPTPATILTPTSLPTIYMTPTNTPTISPPGGYDNTAMLTGLSVIFIVAGMVLLFAL